MLVDALLSPAPLLVLDEAFDGLDQRSMQELHKMVLDEVRSTGQRKRAMMLITHREEDLDTPPSHVLLLGQGATRTSYQIGDWKSMKPVVKASFLASRCTHAGGLAEHERSTSLPRAKPAIGDRDAAAACRPVGEQCPIVEFRKVHVSYGSTAVLDGLSWTVHAGEKWMILGGNGSGKSTILELITGDNLQGYQNDIRLFGRQKGSGESIWSIKAKLGAISTELHMSILDYADPTVRLTRTVAPVSTWEVCSLAVVFYGLCHVHVGAALHTLGLTLP
jgi:molybdate transport system ATP-binding protein